MWRHYRGADLLSVIFGYSEAGMPLYIKDDLAADLVAELAELRGVSKQEAVKQEVRAE